MSGYNGDAISETEWDEADRQDAEDCLRAALGEEGHCEFCGSFGRKDTDEKITYCCLKAFYAYQ